MELTNVDKIAIESLINEGYSPNYIRSQFEDDKQEVAVKYATKMKRKRDKTVAIKPEEPPVKEFDKPALLNRLAKAGIHGEVAERLIKKALPNVSSKPPVDEIYNEVIRNIGPRELMVTTTEGGNKGVAVMTSAASAKGEKIGEKNPQEKKYVFKPNE